MRSDIIVISSIGLQDAAHMLLAQDDKVVHTLAPDRSDQPFGKAILPRRGWRYRLVPDAHGANSAHDDGSNSWTIAQHRSPPLQAVTHVEFPTTWHPKQELSGLRSYAHLLFRAEKRDHLPVERGQIRRLPTADPVAVSDHFTVYPLAAGIANVILDGVIAG